MAIPEDKSIQTRKQSFCSYYKCLKIFYRASFLSQPTTNNPISATPLTLALTRNHPVPQLLNLHSKQPFILLLPKNLDPPPKNDKSATEQAHDPQENTTEPIKGPKLTLVASSALGVPTSGSAPWSSKTAMTARSFLNTTPASGDCPRSLHRLGSAPCCSSSDTSGACPWYAASMSCLHSKSVSQYQPHPPHNFIFFFEWILFATYQRIALVVGQVRRQARRKPLLENVQLAVPRRVEESARERDRFRRERRCRVSCGLGRCCRIHVFYLFFPHPRACKQMCKKVGCRGLRWQHSNPDHRVVCRDFWTVTGVGQSAITI